MEQKSVRFTSLFLAFIILFASCTQYEVQNNLSENLRANLSKHMDVSEQEIAEIMSTVMDAVKYTKSYDVEAVVGSINEAYEDVGYDVQIEVEQVQDMKNYLDLAKNDPKATLNKLVTDEMLSQRQANYIERFNTELEKITDEKLFNYIDAFKQEVKDDDKLAKEEKAALGNYLTLVKSGFESVDSEKTGCRCCIRNNRRAIFGWGSLVILVLILTLCAVLSGPAVFYCAIGVAGVVYAGQICTICDGPCNC